MTMDEIASDVDRVLGRTSRSLVAGAGGLADMARIFSDPLYLGVGKAADKLGYPETAQQFYGYSQAPYVADWARGKFDEATGNRYTPRNKWDTIGDYGAEFFASALAGAYGTKVAQMAAKQANNPKIRALLANEAGSVGGLPMDKASRMARAKEMGFDTGKTWHHGTNESFVSANPLPKNIKAGTGEGATYFTDKSEIANTYADIAGATKSHTNSGPNVISAYSRGKVKEINTPYYNSERFKVEISKAKKEGYDAVLFKGVTDVGTGDQLAVINPSSIRSIHAKFDPAKASSADLLAMRFPLALGGGGLAGMAAMNAEAKEGRR